MFAEINLQGSDWYVRPDGITCTIVWLQSVCAMATTVGASGDVHASIRLLEFISKGWKLKVQMPKDATSSLLSKLNELAPNAEHRSRSRIDGRARCVLHLGAERGFEPRVQGTVDFESTAIPGYAISAWLLPVRHRHKRDASQASSCGVDSMDEIITATLKWKQVSQSGKHSKQQTFFLQQWL